MNWLRAGSKAVGEVHLRYPVHALRPDYPAPFLSGPKQFRIPFAAKAFHRKIGKGLLGSLVQMPFGPEPHIRVP